MTSKAASQQFSTASQSLNIPVIYAHTTGIWCKTVILARGSTVRDALELSGFFRDWPQFGHDKLNVGVYGKKCVPERRLDPGDRVEVYRPLVFDPMESRRRRAAHRKAALLVAGRSETGQSGRGPSSATSK